MGQNMRIQVLVRLKPGVLDVQGKAVESGLAYLGTNGVTDLRIGRLIEFEINESSIEAAKPKIEHMCEALLANPTIEDFEIRELQ